MKSGSGPKPSVLALKERFPHLRKLSQEAGRQKPVDDSPVAALMSRFPDLSFLARPKVSASALADQVENETGQEDDQGPPLPGKKEPLKKQESLAEAPPGPKESTPVPKLRSLLGQDGSLTHAPRKSLLGAGPDVVLPRKSLLGVEQDDVLLHKSLLGAEQGGALSRKSMLGAEQGGALPRKSMLGAEQGGALPRKSMLGAPPEEVERQLCPPPGPSKKVTAEDLFLSSVAMDDDNWLQFQVEEKVPAKEQMAQLQLWLKQNRPSQVHRSQGFGWIAVMLREKGKKILEAKAAWEAYEGQKTMAVVNSLATKFNMLGGKWMCHLPRDGVDLIWSRVGLALLAGGLGQHVYMVKVSPVEDLKPEQSGGMHVLVVYNTDYTNTEQVMRVESLLRSSGVYLPLTYKPDIFSTLGIYRNNRWGFRPTIYSSRALMTEGRSRVETVGTGKWFYNSSRGLQFPNEAGKENIFEGLSVTEVSKEYISNKNVTEGLKDSNTEKNTPVLEVKSEVPSSSVALSRLGAACLGREGLSDFPQKTDVSPSTKKPAKNIPLLEKEDSLNLINTPSEDTEVCEESLKEFKKEKVSKPKSRKVKSAESSENKCSVFDATEISKKTSSMETERLAADGVLSKMLKAPKETSDDESQRKGETLASKKTANYEKTVQKTAPPGTQPKRVQPDWLAKLEELKMRSLDQF